MGAAGRWDRSAGCVQTHQARSLPPSSILSLLRFFSRFVSGVLDPFGGAEYTLDSRGQEVCDGGIEPL